MMFSLAPLIVAAASAAPAVSQVEVVELTVPVQQLAFVGDGPNWSWAAWMRGLAAPALLPRVVVPGWESTVQLPTMTRNTMPLSVILGGTLALRGPRPEGPIQGTLYLTNRAGDGLQGYAFEIPAGTLEASGALWREAEASRYRALASAGIPGTAWFRRRAASLGGGPENDEAWAGSGSSSVGDTFAMFTGGRALAENLALDDVIMTDAESSEMSIDVTDLESVALPAMDFAPLVAGLDIKLDSLSVAIPHDQHAVFFPSFDAVMRVADEVGGSAAPLVQLFDRRGMSARVRERYEAQMCLELDALTRALGGKLIDSVAMTGSDTYLRTGSDVGMLFGGNVEGIDAMMRSRVRGAAREAGVEAVEVEIGGLSVLHAATADRSLCVYIARSDDFVLVANSAVQVERVLGAAAGRIESLDGLPEYRWFRQRYAAGSDVEDAFAVLSDATIRRWAGPQWRIGTSRRTKAAAVLADADAWRMGRGMGLFAEDEARRESLVPDGGAVLYEDGAAREETYGTLGFLTPIAELDIGKVTPAEKLGYESWRVNYERAWTTNFDPIAVRIGVNDTGLDFDLTLVPLIVRTQYRELINMAGDVTLEAEDGDPHDGVIAHWTTALDTRSRFYREVTGFVRGIGNERFGLDWVGDHLSVYMDEDEEYFARASETDSLDMLTEEMLPGLPVGVQIGVKSPLALAGFLTGLRAFVEDAVPGMFEYQARESSGIKYVALVPAEGALFPETPSLFYAALPGALVLSFSEPLIQRAVARSAARREAQRRGEQAVTAPEEGGGWAGVSTGFMLGSGFREALAVNLFELAAREELRARSWLNLPILNEWKRLGAADPVAFHEAQWGIRLLCPGGGEYVWNEAFETMESTVYGHPGAALPGPNLPPGLANLAGVGAGLTFERIGATGSQGLRARLRLDK